MIPTFIYFLGLYISSKTKTRHSPYDVSFLFYEAWLCYLTIVIRYIRGLTLFWRSEHFAQSTTEIVVQYSIIDDNPHCTTMYMYPIDGSRSFHKSGRFTSETIDYFLNIKRYWDVIQSENYKTIYFLELYISSKKKTRHSPYDVSFLFYEAWLCYLTIVIRYIRGLTLFLYNSFVYIRGLTTYIHDSYHNKTTLTIANCASSLR
jgi:hypothetical protein